MPSESDFIAGLVGRFVAAQYGRPSSVVTAHWHPRFPEMLRFVTPPPGSEEDHESEANIDDSLEDSPITGYDGPGSFDSREMQPEGSPRRQVEKPAKRKGRGRSKSSPQKSDLDNPIESTTSTGPPSIPARSSSVSRPSSIRVPSIREPTPISVREHSRRVADPTADDSEESLVGTMSPLAAKLIRTSSYRSVRSSQWRQEPMGLNTTLLGSGEGTPSGILTPSIVLTPAPPDEKEEEEDDRLSLKSVRSMESSYSSISTENLQAMREDTDSPSVEEIKRRHWGRPLSTADTPSEHEGDEAEEQTISEKPETTEEAGSAQSKSTKSMRIPVPRIKTVGFEESEQDADPTFHRSSTSPSSPQSTVLVEQVGSFYVGNLLKDSLGNLPLILTTDSPENESPANGLETRSKVADKAGLADATHGEAIPVADKTTEVDIADEEPVPAHEICNFSSADTSVIVLPNEPTARRHSPAVKKSGKDAEFPTPEKIKTPKKITRRRLSLSSPELPPRVPEPPKSSPATGSTAKSKLEGQAEKVAQPITLPPVAKLRDDTELTRKPIPPRGVHPGAILPVSPKNTSVVTYTEVVAEQYSNTPTATTIATKGSTIERFMKRFKEIREIENHQQDGPVRPRDRVREERRKSFATTEALCSWSQPALRAPRPSWDACWDEENVGAWGLSDSMVGSAAGDQEPVY